jgi:hypothetical protein
MTRSGNVGLELRSARRFVQDFRPRAFTAPFRTLIRINENYTSPQLG